MIWETIKAIFVDRWLDLRKLLHRQRRHDPDPDDGN
jgi:hypothetical protein